MNNEMIVSVLGVVFTIGMSLGVSKTIANRQDKEIEELKDAYEKLADKVSDQKDEARAAFVTFDHFNEAVNSIREMQRDMREDLKKILDVMTSRQHT